MKNKDNHQIDMVHIRHLVALAQCKSLSATCLHLGISRSTLNRSLAELRNHFGNELFLVNKGQYRPTQLAHHLILQAKPALDQLTSLIRSTHNFDFTSLKGDFTIHCPGPFADIFSPTIYGELQKKKSKLDLSVVSWPNHRLPTLNGESLTIGLNGYPFETDGRDDLIQHKIGAFPLGLYARSDHPLMKQDSIEFIDLKHIYMVGFRHSKVILKSPHSQYINQHQLTEQIRVRVNSIIAGFYCIEQFNYGLLAANSHLKFTSLPLDWRPITHHGIPVKFDYGWIYHRAWYQHIAIKEIHQILQTMHQYHFGEASN